MTQRKCKECCEDLILNANFTEAMKESRNYLCNICSKLKSKNYKNNQKLKVFTHYGNKCKCCGEININCLTIDHINNDGAKHRKEININGGHQFYNWIIKNNYPINLRILCFNCNCSLGNNGYCPHNASKLIIKRKDIFRDKNGICKYCGIILNIENMYKVHLEKHRKICKNCYNLTQSEMVLRKKINIMNEYGCKCNNCGISTIEFLAIDHINDNGNKERKEINKIGTSFYGWLKRNNYPKDNYQILCFNCNAIKEHIRR